MNDFLSQLKGRKTYLAAAALAALAWYQFTHGQSEAALRSLAEALGFAGLRNALCPLLPPVTPTPTPTPTPVPAPAPTPVPTPAPAPQNPVQP